MVILSNLLICSRKCLLLSFQSIDAFKRVKKYKLIIFGFWLNKVGWQIKKNLDFGRSPPSHAKSLSKILLSWTILDKFNDQISFWFTGYTQKYMLPSSANDHHETTIFKVDGIV